MRFFKEINLPNIVPKGFLIGFRMRYKKQRSKNYYSYFCCYLSRHLTAKTTFDPTKCCLHIDKKIRPSAYHFNNVRLQYTLAKMILPTMMRPLLISFKCVLKNIIKIEKYDEPFSVESFI